MKTLAPPAQQNSALQSSFGLSHYDDVRRLVVSTLSTSGTPGGRTPSERQLAQQFGVSNATIGRVMHELHRAGLVQRVPGKGTFLKSNAQEMASFLEQAHLTVNGSAPVHSAGEASSSLPSEALSISKEAFTWIVTSFRPEDQSDPAQRWALRASSAVERVVQGAGGRTVLVNTQVQSSFDAAALNALQERGVNSVILISPRVKKDSPQLGHLLMAQQSGESPWPIVQLPFGGETWPFNSINYDGERGIYAAVSHLWNLGHREIGFVRPDLPDVRELMWVRQREWAFQFAIAALSGGNGVGHVVVSPTDLSNDAAFGTDIWEDAAPEAAQILVSDARYSEVTAVLAVNDLMAQRLLGEVRALGKCIPEELSVVGFDDHPWSSSLGLTTLHVPIEEMAEHAVSLVSRQLTSPSENRVEIVLAPPLIVRESTGPCPAGVK